MLQSVFMLDNISNLQKTIDHVAKGLFMVVVFRANVWAHPLSWFAEYIYANSTNAEILLYKLNLRAGGIFEQSAHDGLLQSFVFNPSVLLGMGFTGK